MCDVGMSDSYNFPTIKLILELSFKKKSSKHQTTTIGPLDHNNKLQHQLQITT